MHPSQVWKKKRDEEARHRQGGRERLATVYAVDKNSSAVNVGASWEEVCSKDFTLASAVTVLIHFTANLQNSQACLVEAQVEFDGDVKSYTPTNNLPSSSTWLFSFQDAFERVKAGSKSVKVRLKTSAGSVTVAEGDARLIVEARGIGDPGVDMAPEVHI